MVIATASLVLVGLVSANPAQSAGPAVVDGESGIVAVKVPANQKGAYPLYGLKAAAMVYVEPVERGFTRHIALYGTDKVPLKVGPVRSLRETDFYLLDQFGKVRVYASGHTLSRKVMLDLLDETSHVLRIADDGAQEIYNGTKCVSPFCHFLDGASVPGRNTGLSAKNSTILTEAGLITGALPKAVVAKGKSVRSVTVSFKKIPYSDMIPRKITWEPSKKQWLYEASGRADTKDLVNGKWMTGKTRSATAIIQFTTAKNAGNSYVCRPFPLGGPVSVPYANTVGSGKGLLLRDGKVFDITWSRSDRFKTTSFKLSNGSKVRVAGQPWVFVVPTNITSTSITYASGSKQILKPKTATPKWTFSTTVLKERKACEAPVQIEVVKGAGKATIRVKTNFDSLGYVALKGAKLSVKISGKGTVSKSTSTKSGELVISGDPTKITSVTFVEQVIAKQTYAEKSWRK
jgi:Protein of unknown function (DUF3048) N-terminal domain/Protein of unknown function (DUF3048) C-terminal domain